MQKLDYERHPRPEDKEPRPALMSAGTFARWTIGCTVAANLLILLVNWQVMGPGGLMVPQLFFGMICAGPLMNLLIFIIAIVLANQACGDEEVGPYAFAAVFAPLIGGIVTFLVPLLPLMLRSSGGG